MVKVKDMIINFVTGGFAEPEKKPKNEFFTKPAKTEPVSIPYGSYPVSDGYGNIKIVKNKVSRYGKTTNYSSMGSRNRQTNTPKRFNELVNFKYVKKTLEPVYARQEYVGNNIAFSQIGAYHTKIDMYNQDAFVRTNFLKIVVDGCGQERYSDVGVKIFTQLIENEEQYINEKNFIKILSEVFERMLVLFNTDDLVRKNLLFTVIACIETENSYHVFYCGDGYIITYNGIHVEFIKIDNGEFPEYYAYNYFKDKTTLGQYSGGVKFHEIVFSKSEFENIGVATDGLRGFDKMTDENQLYLIRALKNGNINATQRIIRISAQSFEDDTTISM